MKRIKNILVVVLILTCVFTLTGCGKKEEKKEESKTDYMVVVNKENKLPDNWTSTIELVEVTNGLDETYQVEKKAAEAYEKLRKELADEGVIIELDSTYRTVERQQEIWDDFLKRFGEEYTKTYVAVPGTSEHHTGLAIDVKLVKDGKVIDDNDEMTAETELFGKVHAKLAKYGFILRYPVGKEDITGYGSEVWHFRYIDSPEIAKEIMDKGITLEEYLGKTYEHYIGYQFSGKDPWNNELAVTLRTLENDKLTWTYTDVIGDGENAITIYNELTTEFKDGITSFNVKGNENDYTYDYSGTLTLKEGKLVIVLESGQLTSNSTEGGSSSHQVGALDDNAKTITLEKVVDPV